MSEVVLTNLSNKLFHSSRILLNESAKKFGVNKIKSFQYEELESTEFYAANKAILSQPTGLGYWLWKPYIILEAFNGLTEEDIVIYSDCGIEVIGDLTPLINLCRNNADILLFANSNDINKFWTKRDCFVLMNCDEDKYFNANHCDAAFCLFKKNTRSIQFLKEWLFFAGDINILTDIPNKCGKYNLPEFIEHRRDQSILSLLAVKHRIELYRMPTQFGNHYKPEQCRLLGEFNCVNQSNYDQVDYYSLNPFKNSVYPQLLFHHRKKNYTLNDNNKSDSFGFAIQLKNYCLALTKRFLRVMKNFN